MVQHHVRLGPSLSLLFILWVASQSTYTVAYPSNVIRRLDWPEQDPSRLETEDGEGRIRQRRDVSDVIDAGPEQVSLDRDAGEARGRSRRCRHKWNWTVQITGNGNRHPRHIQRRRKRKVDPAWFSFKAYHKDWNNSTANETSDNTSYENLNYRFWVRDVERHSHRPDVFRYDVNTGCVNITRRVLSNIHIQVTFRDRTGRVNAGIYLNNDRDPVASCLEVLASGSQPPPVEQQCSTSTHQRLVAGDRVCIKTMYADRVVLTKRHLTFWEMVAIRV